MITHMSKIYKPGTVIPKDAIIKNQEITSKSQKLLFELGLVKPAGIGTFYLLPIFQRSVEKCIKIIEKYMNEIGSQKISLPILTSGSLWRKSGRLENVSNELFILNDHQGKEQILSPTHEEAITALVSASGIISYKQLPLRLYQVGMKFRDELKPRLGLIRAKEFLMKDLYTFDATKTLAEETYKEVNKAYMKIFDTLKIPWIKVEGETGIMGGLISHEYHIQSSIGEDKIVYCKECKFASNYSICGNLEKCPQCKANTQTNKSIEIGHTFLLGEKYSSVFNAIAIQPNSKHLHLFMGCFGIGVTRLLASSIEVLSCEDKIIWPSSTAPFEICIIPAKFGSKEYHDSDIWTTKVITEAANIFNYDDIILDDRTNMTIGKRLSESKRLGLPYIVVIGSKVMEPESKFELYYTERDEVTELNFNELICQIKANYTNESKRLIGVI